MVNPIELDAARARILDRVQPCTRVETVPLGEAHGRVLASPIYTDGPWPATDRSAMDGFAVVAGDEGLPEGAALPVVGESLAGRPFGRDLRAGEAIRIMTGAVVPAGADAVVPVERSSGYQGEQVTFSARIESAANIRRMGSERPAGVEVLSAGRRLDAAAVGALAVLGRHEVEVRSRPAVAIVATGDEVVPVEATPLPHQVRESNSWALAAQVAECGGVAARCGIAPDDPAALRGMLEQALRGADFVITIGGISKGTHDLVHETLASLGVADDFHGVKFKPGKPTYFGARHDGGSAQYVFGLPGNPAASFTVFDLLVRPAIKRWYGSEPGAWGLRVKLGEADWKTNWRAQAVRAELGRAVDGSLCATLSKPSASGDPFSLLHGSCYALIAAGQARADVDSIEIAGGSKGVDLP